MTEKRPRKNDDWKPVWKDFWRDMCDHITLKQQAILIRIYVEFCQHRTELRSISGLSLTESLISKKLGVPKTSVFRTLNRCYELGWASKDEHGVIHVTIFEDWHLSPRQKRRYSGEVNTSLHTQNEDTMSDAHELKTDAKNDKENDKEKDKDIYIGFDLVDLWNKHCTKFTKALHTNTPIRKTHIKARLKEHPDEKFWIDLFNIMNSRPFLYGDNDNGWSANFSWVIKGEDNILKVLEGLGIGRKKQKKLYTEEDFEERKPDGEM